MDVRCQRLGNLMRWVERTALPEWIAIGLIAYAASVGVNVSRSIEYRRDLGGVIVSLDAAYTHIRDHVGVDNKLVLLPGFLRYGYPQGISPVIDQRVSLVDAEDIRTMPTGSTYALSWAPSLAEHLEVVRVFPGCDRRALTRRRSSRCSGSTTRGILRWSSYRRPLPRERDG